MVKANARWRQFIISAFNFPNFAQLSCQLLYKLSSDGSFPLPLSLSLSLSLFLSLSVSLLPSPLLPMLISCLDKWRNV